MLKKFNLSNCIIIRRRVLILFLLLTPFSLFAQVIRKSTVSFSSSDGLVVTADKYLSKKSSPYIILFHTEGSSRGEFNSIAERFVKMNYNCLAVDLRSGGKYGFTTNETAGRAKENGLNTSLYESIKDIQAAMEYVKTISNKPFILLGSSYSASLSLITAKEDPSAKAVIAFSPGEFFLPEINLQKIISDYKKPVFAAFSAEEYPFFAVSLESGRNESVTIFKPSYGPGKRTVEALLSTSGNSEDYWFALMVFFRSLR